MRRRARYIDPPNIAEQEECHMPLRPIESLSKQDIDHLVAVQTPENRNCEYKAVLPGNSETEKKEFLADVSSFANAGGGRIYYGIPEKRGEKGEKTGLPDEPTGLSDFNSDGDIQRLEHLLSDGVAPRIPGVHFKPIDDFPRGPILVLHIPQSWVSPHMVILQKWNKFFSRNSNGKQPLDVHQLRAAFADSEAIDDRLKRFRDDRLARIVAGETPIALHEGGWVAIHVLPLSSFAQRNSVNLTAVHNEPYRLKPYNTTSYNMRYNTDGVCVWSSPHGGTFSFGYNQLFRTGAVEGVNTFISGSEENQLILYNTAIQKIIIHVVTSALQTMSFLSVPGPYVVTAAIYGARDAVLEHVHNSIGMHSTRINHYRIDRDMLVLPDILLDQLPEDGEEALCPLFDVLWQAGGEPGYPAKKRPRQ